MVSRATKDEATARGGRRTNELSGWEAMKEKISPPPTRARRRAVLSCPALAPPSSRAQAPAGRRQVREAPPCPFPTLGSLTCSFPAVACLPRRCPDQQHECNQPTLTSLLVLAFHQTVSVHLIHTSGPGRLPPPNTLPVALLHPQIHVQTTKISNIHILIPYVV